MTPKLRECLSTGYADLFEQFRTLHWQCLYLRQRTTANTIVAGVMLLVNSMILCSYKSQVMSYMSLVGL